MKRKLSLLLVLTLLCTLFAMPVSAAELPDEDVSTSSAVGAAIDEIMPAATTGSNYFSKITTKLNSVNGSTASSSLSSGSCSGTTRSITEVTVYCRVSSGSSNFLLTVTSPSGKVQTMSCSSSSSTYTFTGFNGEDPKGTWNVAINSRGVVSTVTATMKVYYDYSF